ncbi:MAG: Gfo/Idh/MocA family oxidoreductase [Rhizobiales bacterium]|nr:Gfo/Idh/MocA family oxidoreductase [Hyphomicrobiales bacterium]
MAKQAGIGIIGCGTISEAYLRLAPNFANLKVVAVADIVAAAARTRAEQFGLRALGVDELLRDESISTVINLTVPAVHYEVSRSILSAGKNAYSEKPLALTAADARKLVAEADRRGLKLGGAPDTFLGAAGQAARRMLDKGAIGDVIAGSAHVMGHGMEHWHPQPGFYFKPGGGPVFDMGPYYITALVNLLGAVKGVAAMATRGFAERTVTAAGPMTGQKIKVRTPTTISAVLEFASGTQITFGASWDVWRHGHQNPIELYGTDGTMLVPDPNFFAGTISVTEKGSEYREVETGGEAFGAANWPFGGPFTRANYRMLGVADLVDAAAKGREPRCSGRLAAHVVEVMESILVSAAEKRFVKLRSSIERPAPLTAADAKRFAARTA